MKTYNGSCHCGTVKYEVGADIKEVMECNCSHCDMQGYKLAFVPESQVKILLGKDELSEYRFNKKHIAHKFCKNCGAHPFGSAKDENGNEVYAINVRTLDTDHTTIPIKKVDGKSL